MGLVVGRQAMADRYLLMAACAPSHSTFRANSDSNGALDASLASDSSTAIDAGRLLDASTSEEVGNPVDGGQVDPCADWVERLQLGEQMMANPGFGRRRLQRPIVLHHGMAGFRELGPLAYFSDVPSHLRSLGYEVYLTQVLPINGKRLSRGTRASTAVHQSHRRFGWRAFSRTFPRRS